MRKGTNRAAVTTNVALAERLSLPLVTADEGLVHKLAGAGRHVGHVSYDLDVRFIGEWP
jgi:hypothetical protein